MRSVLAERYLSTLHPLLTLSTLVIANLPTLSPTKTRWVGAPDCFWRTSF
jgi:hypothetical protein